MAKIVLISCSSQKSNQKSKAQDLYTSPLFKKCLRYAKSLRSDKIFILSAKHHLLPLSKTITPYDESLNDMYSDEIKRWADRVIKNLKKVSDLDKDHFTILAGETYWKELVPNIKNKDIPMKGMRIGKQLGWLTKKLSICDKCYMIHKLFNSLPKYSFSFDEKDIPDNGIYILFEKGELGHGTNRIVRVGTHRGLNQLHSRLLEHFLTKNKDRSIFRKNIGRALLNKKNDPFMKQWELDLTSKDARDKYSSSIDFVKLEEVEKNVSKYIQTKFSFVVFPIEDSKKRLELESRIISTVSGCNECQPSDTWLGLYSTVKDITKSGLWLKQGLWKTPLSNTDMKMFNQIFKKKNQLRR